MKNLGDDLMLKAAIDRYKDRYRKIYIIGNKSLKKYYADFGVKVVAQDSFFYRVLNKVFKTLKMPELFYLLCDGRSDFLMLGGSLFIELDNERLTAMKLKNLECAVKRSRNAFVVGSNFGPFHSEAFFEGFVRIFGNCKDVCFRDVQSCDMFAGKCNVRYAPDTVLGMELGEGRAICDGDPVVISVINLENRNNLSEQTECYEKLMASVAAYHAQKGDRVILASFCDNEGDLAACERIRNYCDETLEIVSYESLSVLDVLSGANKIYGARFHAVMLAMRYGIPCMPIVYSAKTVNALLSYGVSFDSVDITNLSGCSAEDLTERAVIGSIPSDLTERAKKQFEVMDLCC